MTNERIKEFVPDEKMSSAEIKALAKRVGADCVGIAPMSRWEGAPKQNDPRYIFPGAKSMVVLGFRIPRGLLRGIEEGTRFIDYPGMGYASLNQVHGPMVLWKLNARRPGRRFVLVRRHAPFVASFLLRRGRRGVFAHALIESSSTLRCRRERKQRRCSR